MPEKSMFQPGGDGMTRGGLDRFNSPPAGDYSNLPPSIEDPKSDPEDSKKVIDCAGKDSKEAVCEIANAEEEEREMGSNAT